MMKPQLNRFLYRPEVIILLMMTVGFLLVFFAPLWLKPPYFEYTIFIYLVLFFAWLPVCLIFAWHKRSKRFAATFIVLGICLMVFTSLAILPNSLFNLPMSDPTSACNEYIYAGHSYYNCYRLGMEGSTVYYFEVLEGLPLMRFGGLANFFGPYIFF